MIFLPSLRAAVAAILLAGAAMFSVLPAQAQQEISPEHLAKAREYVDLSDSAQLYEVTLVETGLQVMRLMIGENPSYGDELIEAIQTVYDGYLESRDPLYSQFARVYALRFSLEELEQIVDFYSTDVGRKLLAQNAAINEDLQMVLSIWSRNTATEFLGRVRSVLRTQGGAETETPPAEGETAD